MMSVPEDFDLLFEGEPGAPSAGAEFGLACCRVGRSFFALFLTFVCLVLDCFESLSES